MHPGEKMAKRVKSSKRKKVDSVKYSFNINWNETRQKWVITSPDLPRFEAASESFEEAPRVAKEEILKFFERLSQSTSLKQFTGKFILRVEPDLHKQLAFEARNLGVSLNKLITNILKNRK